MGGLPINAKKQISRLYKTANIHVTPYQSMETEDRHKINQLFS